MLIGGARKWKYQIMIDSLVGTLWVPMPSRLLTLHALPHDGLKINDYKKNIHNNKLYKATYLIRICTCVEAIVPVKQHKLRVGRYVLHINNASVSDAHCYMNIWAKQEFSSSCRCCYTYLRMKYAWWYSVYNVCVCVWTNVL